MRKDYEMVEDNENAIDAVMEKRDFGPHGYGEVTIDKVDVYGLIGGEVLLVDVNNEYTVRIRVKV